MDLYISKIELNKSATKSDMFDLLNQWLKGSKYKLELKYNGSDESYSVNNTKTHSKISILSTFIKNYDVFAWRFENEDKQGTWIIDFIYINNSESNTVYIKLSCKTDTYTRITRFNKPFIFKNLMDSGLCKSDGLFPITDMPVRLTKQDISCCAKIMKGEIATNLPVVYVSFNMYNKHLYEIDVDMLAKKLAGIAHVLVEPDYSFSIQLKKLCDSRNPFNGYLGIYFPNTRYKHIFNPSDDDEKLDREQVVEKINEVLREATLNYANVSDWDWSGLQLEYSKRNYERQKDETKQKSKELDDYMNSFDEDIREKDEEIFRLRNQLKSKEEKISSLQSKIAGLNARLSGYQTKYESETSVEFDKNGINEFYPNEVKDAILNILCKCMNKLDKEGRPYALFSKLIENNKSSGYCETILNELEQALTEKNLNSRREKLRAIDFTVIEGSHDKIVFKNEEGYTFTLANTPGDKAHGIGNQFSDIAKRIDINIKI